MAGLCHLRQFAQSLDAAFDGAAGAAAFLNGHMLELAIGAQAGLADQRRDLQHFTAQTDQQDAREIRVLGIALQGAEQGLIAFIIPRHAAA